MIPLRIINAIWNSCIASASSLIGPALPVIGFSRILVITQNNIEIVVPVMPIENHIFPHCLIIGTSQNTGAAPAIKNKISALPICSYSDKIYKFI